MAMLRVYKATFNSLNYLFKNGKPAIFVSGRFCTDVESEIKELDEEIAQKHPHIFIDSNEREVDSTALDPMANLRATIIAEYLAKEAAKDPNQDMGNYAAGKLVPANSKDVAVATLGGATLLKVAAPSAAKLV